MARKDILQTVNLQRSIQTVRLIGTMRDQNPLLYWPKRVIILRKYMILCTRHHGLTYLLIVAYIVLDGLPLSSAMTSSSPIVNNIKIV